MEQCHVCGGTTALIEMRACTYMCEACRIAEVTEDAPAGSSRNVRNPRACDLHLTVDCPQCIPAERRAAQFDVCTCTHTARDHDGYGCTVPGCACMADFARAWLGNDHGKDNG